MSAITAIFQYAAIGAVLDTTVYAIMKYGTITPFIDIHFEGMYILAFVVTALGALLHRGRGRTIHVMALFVLRVGLSTTVLDWAISFLPIDVDDRIAMKQVIRSLVGAHLWSREGAYVQRVILWMCLGFCVSLCTDKPSGPAIAPSPTATAPAPPAHVHLPPHAVARVPPSAVAPSAVPTHAPPNMGCMQLNNNYGHHCTSHYHAVRADDSHLVRARVCADYEREMLA